MRRDDFGGGQAAGGSAVARENARPSRVIRSRRRLRQPRMTRKATYAKVKMARNARIGKTTAITLRTTAEPDSIVAKTGLARPPVKAVDTLRPVTVAAWTAPAAPPPMIAARPHLSRSPFEPVKVNWLATTSVPATTAAGDAMVSRAWSTQGILYARISTTVATLKQISAGVLARKASDGLR
ncbi:MAG: hypothetical protein QM783_10290 [Phycisphaerales bacterium]